MRFDTTCFALVLLSSIPACSRRAGGETLKPEPLTCGDKQDAVLIDLPRASSGAEIVAEMRVVVPRTGEILVDDQRCTDDDVRARARDAVTKNPSVRAVILADESVSHGRVIHAIDLLKQGGVDKVGFGVRR